VEGPIPINLVFVLKQEAFQGARLINLIELSSGYLRKLAIEWNITAFYYSGEWNSEKDQTIIIYWGVT